MHINATVFIQAINFGITYLFLRKVLFKPVVQRIKQKDTAKNMLIGTIKDKEAFLHTLQSEKLESLVAFRQNAKQFYAIDITCEKEIPTMLAYQKDTAIQEQLIAETKNLLIAKVPHAY